MAVRPKNRYPTFIIDTFKSIDPKAPSVTPIRQADETDFPIDNSLYCAPIDAHFGDKDKARK
jgi:hypothetical protein